MATITSFVGLNTGGAGSGSGPGNINNSTPAGGGDCPINQPCPNQQRGEAMMLQEMMRLLEGFLQGGGGCGGLGHQDQNQKYYQDGYQAGFQQGLYPGAQIPPADTPEMNSPAYKEGQKAGRAAGYQAHEANPTPGYSAPQAKGAAPISVNAPGGALAP